ncbi:MAG TPA: hypothetical protein VKD72_23700, partial [Gemmataceae bacterium]|nr:hypothetical protein [Gemmataceae bacterium]
MMSIFGRALERSSAEERTAYLDEACGQDGALRARIDALLRAHEEAGGFLRQGPGTQAPEATVEQPAGECPGTRIGPYKLLELIGEGGMGE